MRRASFSASSFEIPLKVVYRLWRSNLQYYPPRAPENSPLGIPKIRRGQRANKIIGILEILRAQHGEPPVRLGALDVLLHVNEWDVAVVLIALFSSK